MSFNSISLISFFYFDACLLFPLRCLSEFPYSKNWYPRLPPDGCPRRKKNMQLCIYTVSLLPPLRCVSFNSISLISFFYFDACLLFSLRCLSEFPYSKTWYPRLPPDGCPRRKKNMQLCIYTVSLLPPLRCVSFNSISLISFLLFRCMSFISASMPQRVPILEKLVPATAARRVPAKKEEYAINMYLHSFAFISASMRLLMLALTELETMESVFELNMQ